MTNHQISIQYLVKRLRHKYKDNPTANALLDKILWYSIPVVYPNWEYEQRAISKQINNRKQKKRRAKHYLHDMQDVYGVDALHFVTLTFNDDTLSSTSERTRHRYVTAYLNEHCLAYYGNIDYGKKNEREHYHAVVKLRSDTLPPFPYGFHHVKAVQSVKKKNADINCIATYINKLVCHANKATTGRAFRSKVMEADIERELPF